MPNVIELDRTALLIGGPDAGKTNYLTRLWLAIDQGHGRLRAHAIPQNLDYLRAIAEVLLSGNFVPHTSREIHHETRIPVVDSSEGQDRVGHLIVPDASGEEWADIYRKREWPPKWHQYISDTSGCLLFVRVDSKHNSSPLDWISCEKLFAKVPEIVGVDVSKENRTPTQVILVDWLQLLRRAYTDRANSIFRPRIGIIVAAWDLVPFDRQQKGPDAYLEAEYPLLYQFIHTNLDDFQFSIFGVSALGGDLSGEPGFRERFLNDPTGHGYIVQVVDGKLATSDDLTLPVRWAMGL
jgi:hypothetical protein